MGEERRYDPEQVRDILGRAAARSTDAGDAIGHRALVEAAREAGIDAAAVEEAIRESDRAKARGEIEVALREKHRRAAAAHAVAFFAAVGTFLLFAPSPARATSAQMLGFVWLLALMTHVVTAFSAPDQAEVEELLRAREALERAHAEARAAEAAAHAAREAEQARVRARKASRDQLSAAAARLESAVEQGVSAALQAAANRIESLTAKSGVAERAEVSDRASPSDFARYVAARTGRTEPAAAPREAAARTGVRVAVEPAPRETNPARETAREREDRAAPPEDRRRRGT
jgi:hypothetical protein